MIAACLIGYHHYTIAAASATRSSRRESLRYAERCRPRERYRFIH